MLSIEMLMKLASTSKKDKLLSSLNKIIGTKSEILGQKLSGLKHQSREVKSLVRLYQSSSTEKFVDRPDTTPLLIKANSRNLTQLQARHAGVIDALTEIMTSQSFKESEEVASHSEDILQEQICLGVLIQHAAQIADLKAPREFGVIRIDEPVEELCAFARMQTIALANHNMAAICPAIEMEGVDNLKLTCVPSLVEFAILECLKNAVYSSMKMMSSDNNIKAPPPVVIRATEEERQITVEIRDQGVGMTAAECQAALLFDPGFARSTKGLVDQNRSYQPMSAPLRGFGVGCVLAKLHLHAVNLGDLRLVSPGPGLGATAVLMLAKPEVEMYSSGCV